MMQKLNLSPSKNGYQLRAKELFAKEIKVNNLRPLLFIPRDIKLNTHIKSSDFFVPLEDVQCSGSGNHPYMKIQSRLPKN